MTAPIPDPHNPSQAILPNGRIGHRAHWIPTPADPTRITQADLDQGIDLGYVEGDFHP